MVTGIGKFICDALDDLMLLIATITIVLIVASALLTRWYYSDTISLGSKVEAAKYVCERTVQRDQYCKVTITAIPVD